MIGRRIARFRVLEKIGEGGMATVWKAHDDLLDRIVALKILAQALADSEDARRRFRHEAEVASRLDHPGIAPIYAAGVEDGVTYMAMAFVDGETLIERLSRSLMPIPEAIEVMRVAATALGYAHGMGVVHRDVTSRNIMIGRDGRVFVLDFGLAIAAGISRITSRNTTVGTIAYMAPELLEGRAADARSDLYGLGVVFYEALTGTLPFAAGAPEALKYAALHQNPRPPRERRPAIGPELERIVLKAIERDPDRRYQRADDLLDDLQAATSPGPGAEPARPVSPATRTLSEGDPLYLAVVPFESTGEDQDGAAKKIADELTATLGATLAHVGRVHVVPLGKHRPPGETMPELRSFARTIGAQVLLHGAVRRQGSQLRVSYTLTDPEASVQIGGGALSGATTERFDFEDRVVAHVRESLGGRARTTGLAASRPPDPAAPERYAQAMGYLKRYDNEASVDGAIRLLEQLVASEHGSAAYHAGLARAYLRKQELTQEHVWESRAAEACERARSLAPEAPESLLALGDLQVSTGRYDDARATFEKALERNADEFDVLIGISRACGKSGELDEAERASLRAVAARLDDWRGHSHLGWVYFRRGEFAAAVEPWRRVVELTPDNAKGRRNVGSALYRLDRFEDAISAYRESLAIQPDCEAYGNLGTALYFLGHHDEALTALRKATELAPSDPIRWGNLGNACFQLGKRGSPPHEREALAALDMAIGLMRERLGRNPNLADGWAWLAGWLSNRGRRVDAEAAIRRALDLAPADSNVMARAGHVFYQLGNRAECFRWLWGAKQSGYGVWEFAHSIEFAPLRDDPEFKRLLEDTSSGTDGVSQGERV